MTRDLQWRKWHALPPTRDPIVPAKRFDLGFLLLIAGASMLAAGVVLGAMVLR